MKRISYKNIFKILSVYLLIYIPIALKRFPDIRNEIKYFLIADNLISNREFFILKYFSELYPDKPPLYFWLLAFFKNSSENFIFLTLLFGSIIPSLIIVLLMYKLFTRLKNERFGFLVAISLATTPFFIGTSIFLRMDMLMSLFITISLYYFFSIYFNLIENSWGNREAIYLGVFLGVFTKGIAGALVPLSIILVFLILEKNLVFLKKINFFYGMGLIFLGIIAWILVIYNQPQGKEYLLLMFGQETVGRIVKAKTHIKPFYFYITRISFLLFPYSIFWYYGVFSYLKDIKNYRKWEPLEKIGVIWSLVPLLFFSIASGKLDIYMLPLFGGMLLLSINIFIKEKKQYKRFLLLPLTIFITFGILAQGMDIFNKYFTLKPIISEIKDNRKIYTYNFYDLKNLQGLNNNMKVREIINIQDIQKLEECIELEEEKAYLVVKAKYRDRFATISKLQLKFNNNSYCIFECR